MTKTALITGGSRGIGLAIKEEFIKNNISVLSPSRDEMDLSNPASIDQYLQKLNIPVDVVVNNAGILKIGRYNELTVEDFNQIFQINSIAPFRIISRLVEEMKERNFGRIVNISSIWGHISKIGRSPYAASKSALDALTRSLALEFGPYNILINSIAPGYINTDMLRLYNSKEELENIKQSIPVKKFGDPSDIAKLTTFLCSESNSYITGQTLIIDGGFTCK